MKISEIEQNVRIPSKYEEGVSYGFHLMEVGDSKTITLDKTDKYAVVRSAISTAASVLGIQLGMKFRVKKEGEGLRIWRIK